MERLRFRSLLVTVFFSLLAWPFYSVGSLFSCLGRCFDRLGEVFEIVTADAGRRYKTIAGVDPRDPDTSDEEEIPEFLLDEEDEA